MYIKLPFSSPVLLVVCYLHTLQLTSYRQQINVSIIKTHDSESRGQEEAGRMRRMSVLFTGNTAMKFVNALNKPP